MSQKPVVFISHSSKDDKLAKALQEQIMRGLGITNAADVFVSSTPDSIRCGEPWFSRIIHELERADIFIVLLTQNSIVSNWVWFEIGHFWHKEKLYPLYVEGTDIPHPLSTKQAKSLTNHEQLNNFFATLCKEFGGSPEIVDVAAIMKLAEDLGVDHIKQVISERLEYEYEQGEWIAYTQWDRELNLPKGTTEKYLPKVAKNWEFDQQRREAGGTALYPPPSPSNPPGDPF